MFQHSGHCQYQTAMTLDLCQKIIKVIQPEKTAGLLEELQPFRVRSAPEMLTNTNVREWKETRASQPLMSISIFLFPVFGSTPSRPVLYLPCPCSDREIHTWRTLSVGYCMFISRHQRIHSVPHCDSHLTFPGQFPKCILRLRLHLENGCGISSINVIKRNTFSLNSLNEQLKFQFGTAHILHYLLTAIMC